MRITLSDDLVDTYAAYAKKQGRSLDAVIEAQLSKFKSLEPGKPSLTLGGEARQKVETALGGLPLRNAEDLVSRVERLAGVSFQHLRLDFSPSHLEELAHRAERQGKSVEALIIETVDKIRDQFFWTSGAGESVLVREPVAKAG